jgi:hypothetical protein
MNIVWHRIVRPEGAFVREDTDGGVVEYGPMPEAMMLPLIAERKVFFESLFARQVETMLDRQTAYPMV